MSLSRLVEVLPPPSSPVETGTPDSWERIREELGATLPDDYKAFIQTYGSGWIGGFISIWDPFSENKYLNLVQSTRSTLQAIRMLKVGLKKELNIDEPPYPLFPEPGGLLPFGATIAGDVLFWKTEGTPAAWTIVIHRVRSTEYEEHPFTITEFLNRLMRGDIEETFIYETSFSRGAGFEQP